MRGTRWTTAMDADLRRLTTERWTPAGIAGELNRIYGLSLTDSAVLGRQATLGIRVVLTRRRSAPANKFFTKERNEELASMWERGVPLQRIRQAFNYAVGVQAISLQAKALNLPTRYRKAVGGRLVMRVRSEGYAGEAMPKHAPAPVRFTLPKVKGCAFIDPCGDGSRCGEGDEQYCPRHRARVIPISKGMLGLVGRHSHAVAGIGRTGR